METKQFEAAIEEINRELSLMHEQNVNQRAVIKRLVHTVSLLGVKEEMKITKEQIRQITMPGMFVLDNNRIPMEDPIPKNCIAHKVLERTVMDYQSEKLYGEWKQVGKEVVFGKILTLSDVLMGSILYNNMIGNGWDKVIKTRRGNVIAYNKNMEVVDEN